MGWAKPNPTWFPKPGPGLVLAFSSTCLMPVGIVAGLGRHIEVGESLPKALTVGRGSGGRLLSATCTMTATGYSHGRSCRAGQPSLPPQE